MSTATMNPIFPISALQKRQAEVRAAAQEDVVRITENGTGAYVFCSEEVFAQALEQAAEDALYEARVREGIERGLADVAAGRVYTDIDAAFAEIERRAQHG